MKRIIQTHIILILCVGTADGASPQEAPQLENGSPYPVERKKIIANGWVKVAEPGSSCNRFDEPYRSSCISFPELSHCGDDDNCSFFWRDKDGYYLEIYTYDKDLGVSGYAYPAVYKGSTRSVER
ncbi:hypothetical protein [Synechococcus sp. 1G10]|uniref:hypothetical protein n=1 Tax=Synechococcus sp. 1G10 TaxID=2025605 RepID=UPI000B993615|nr:hypothetical protein [Synechococcus sp. 1G10]